ncbi:MAG: hypothetical protein RLZ35_1251, partial [Pseudomonadota bacterium]
MLKQQADPNFFKEKYIWLTGATSGIGLSLLEKLLKKGSKVIATGRHQEKIAHLVDNASCFFLQSDFEEKINTKELTKSLLSITDTLDIVILNAGICEYLDDPK